MEFTLLSNFPEASIGPTGQPLDPASEWNHLLNESITHVPFLRYEYMRAWWETRGGGEWPGAELALLVAREGGHLTGIAPLFFDKNREELPALLLLGSIEISDYLDLIVRPADLKAFLPGLLDFLTTSPELPPWRLLDWQNIPEASPTIPVLNTEAEKRGWRTSVERSYHTPAIPLPGDYETYLSGIDKKQRHEIRRKMRRAAETGTVRWYILEDEKDLDSGVDAFLALMAGDPEKATFLTDAMRRQMHLSCRAAFENGWLQLAFLEVDGEKAAGYLNFDMQDRIWVYNSGVDRRFLELSPGWVLLGHLLEWANENKRSEFDFMRGEEEYKYRFGAVDRFVVRTRVER
jgi:CelD/BcsL family acetyltransferase involved in cellulose biosynthesis